MLQPEVRELTHVHELVFTLGTRATKPIVAAAHGNVLAGGVGLAANAHILLAAGDASFGLTEIRIGLWPFLIYRAVAMAIGERRAVELSMTGRLFDAREAERMGLVHEVVPTEQLAQRALEVSRSLADSSPNALRNGLLFVGESRGKSITEAGKIAFRFREEMFRSADFAEGLRAFHEKRRPEWPKSD
jgi:enoyl-CoA hydratase/carnithine racemase